ncbi:MAG TPA: Gfo/Idh/MocA family oxidoreductase [Candidatus Baltobacteraceae bacterium]|nr:Gfo/Idh/MocA family oxidoreductase [Candidatus Baltobacteraceae bacterium]
MINVALAGQGAFGVKHLEAIANIDGVNVISLTGGRPESTQAVAERFRIPHWTTDLGETLARPGLDAVIIASPTQIHRRQAEQSMRAGKHVLVEIPVADSVEDARALVEVQRETGVVAMAGHVRRFNPSHRFLHERIERGEFNVQQMDVQTYFFRRTNTNALGQPRSWTDHLLWHHACHTVDLFQWQTGGTAEIAQAIQGPVHPALGIAMDMSIQLKAPSGAILTLSLSFNNDGPFGSFFRYIGDTGTYLAYYDDLSTGKNENVDLSGFAVSNNGIELEDREFFAAIAERREPQSSLVDTLPAYETLARLEQQLGRFVAA